MPRAATPKMTSARAVAARAIDDAAKSFPDIDAQPIALEKLDPRDTRLALAIHRGVLQRWLTLEYILNLYLRKPLRTMEPALQGVLLTAAAQLLFMDRLPAHAVVDEAVKLARTMVRPGAAGLVNAVLRRVSELPDRAVEGKPWHPAEDRLPLENGYVPLRDACLPAVGAWSNETPAHELNELEKHLSVAASHPVQLVRRWLKEHGATKTIDLCAAGLRTPPVIAAVEAEGEWGQETGDRGQETADSGQETGDRGQGTGNREQEAGGRRQEAGNRRQETEETEADGENFFAFPVPCLPSPVPCSPSPVPCPPSPAPFVPHDQLGFILWHGPHAELTAFLRAHPARRVQDPTSAAVVAAASHLAPGLILDYCAGRGTKTRQLAATFPSATIIATDTDDDRRAILHDAFANHPRVRVVHPRDLATTLSACASAPAAVDLLLLDVPCTNTGVLARRPEARYRFNEASLKSLVRLQRSIIEKSLPLLAPGAHLLYSTCSIDHHENEHQSRWIVEQFGCELIQQALTLPSGTGSAYHDGGYFALLRKT